MRFSGFVLTMLAVTFAAGQQYTISTYAGGAPPPTPAPAVTASIGSPLGMATDSTGNVYFSSANCVFKTDASGTLTRIAGTSRIGYSGDGGPAASAQLNSPNGVALDTAGNLFIADTNNQRVRKVSPNGIITTVAGGGSVSVGPSRGDGGLATSAVLYNPFGVAVDAAGNLFIADSPGLVRKVSPDGTITTVAGTVITTNGQKGNGDSGPATSATLKDPRGLVLDAAGNLFIADFVDHRVRRVSPNGTITTVAGNGSNGSTYGAFSGDGGTATNAQLGGPLGMAVDVTGNLFISDSYNNRIRKVAPTGLITTVAGGGSATGDSGPATNALLAGPTSVATDTAGNLFIADTDRYRVRRVSLDGTIYTIAGNGQSYYSGDNGRATSAQLSGPYGLAMDAGGSVYITDGWNYRVRKISRDSTIATVAGNGEIGYSGDGGPAIKAQLKYTYGVAVDATGNLFIADPANCRIRRVSVDGIITTAVGNGVCGYSGDSGPATSAQVRNPQGLAIDAVGNLFIADNGDHRIRRVSQDGTITTVAGNGQQGNPGDGGLATSAHLSYPTGVAVDAAGNLFIADSGNYRIRKVAPNGIITSVAGNGIYGNSGDGGPATSATLSDPAGLAVDAAGNLFIADGADNRVRKVSPTGIINTVAGNGQLGYSGDGGPGTSAQLNYPSGLAVDTSGNLYIADNLNGSIRLLTPSTQPVPAINTNGVVDAAAYKTSVSPGGITSVFGTSLASSSAGAASVPLSTTLAGASLTLGGKSAPLFYASPGQINFQIPWELAGQTQATIVPTTSSGGGSGANVALSVVSPGIFTTNSSGSGQGSVTDAITGQLASAASPIPRGQYITIYCTGLGAVSNQPATGAASGSNSVTTLLPVVTIGSVQALVSFSGLAPGFVGLYQVNAIVPSAVTPGSAVSLALTINGVSSNTVTIAVQ